MEVHHHPHVDSNSHRKKRFKEYFLEFIMIFLAVTLGFFAESAREHISDRKREKEFVLSMVQDLKSDTSAINNAIAAYTHICKVSDTLLMCLKSGDPDPSLLGHLISNRFWLYNGFSYNNRTIQELKNAGNFRLITNKKVADSIIDYDYNMNAFVMNQYNDLKTTMMSYKDAESKVVPCNEFDTSFLNYLSPHFDPSDFTIRGKHTIISHDKALIFTYYNKVFLHETLCFTFIHGLQITFESAKRLILFIKREYNIEDE